METPKTTPKDFFLYVGAMVTLYWSAGSLIALLFATIDTVLKDQLGYYFDPYSGGIRFAIASLIVIFPICLILLRAIKKEVMGNPEKLSLAIRRWLFSFTIFVTAIAMAADLIALLNTFLGGEITSRFILKVLAVLIVSGLLFWYSLLEIRLKAGAASIRKEFFYGAPVLVLAAIVYGFVVMGSPTTIRSLRMDSQRVSDLQNIQWQIVNYWQQKAKLPETLADLRDPISGFVIPTDPRTGASYEFTKGTGQEAFTLCATFEKADSTQGNGTVDIPRTPTKLMSVSGNENWYHESGRYCFDRNIDPDLYPVRVEKAVK